MCACVAHAHQRQDPDDELHVVDGVEADEDDAGDEVILLLDLDHRADAMPETDGRQGHHGSQDVPVLYRVQFNLVSKV